MNDGFRNRCRAVSHARDEVVFVEVVADAALREILEFLRLGEIVDGDDVVDAFAVEVQNTVAADEACGSGHKNRHLISFSKKFFISDARRTELADDDAARLIGDADSFLQIEPCGDHGGGDGN